MEVKACMGQVDIVLHGQRQQTEMRKNLMIHICQKESPLCLPSLLPWLYCLTLDAGLVICLIREESPPQKETPHLFQLRYLFCQISHMKSNGEMNGTIFSASGSLYNG